MKEINVTITDVKAKYISKKGRKQDIQLGYNRIINVKRER